MWAAAGPATACCRSRQRFLRDRHRSRRAAQHAAVARRCRWAQERSCRPSDAPQRAPRGARLLLGRGGDVRRPHARGAPGGTAGSTAAAWRSSPVRSSPTCTPWDRQRAARTARASPQRCSPFRTGLPHSRARFLAEARQACHVQRRLGRQPRFLAGGSAIAALCLLTLVTHMRLARRAGRT